jgi:protein required for attachment to host cells
MNVRIVVADERQAAFYDLFRPSGPLEVVGGVENEAGGKRDFDLESDRPGRRSGGMGQHHDVDGERSSAHHELTLFARAVAHRLYEERNRREFDKLVLMAPPKMLGMLRQAMPSTCKDAIASEIAKDLLHRGADAIIGAVPREVFFH